jgi:glucokinase
MRILAGDVGGTKTLLRMLDEKGSTLREQRFESREFGTFDEVVDAFLANEKVGSACFAVAGPVRNGEADVTNLTWMMRERDLASRFDIARVRLVNDFYAVARGVPLLGDDDLVMINRGKRDTAKPIAILGAGTGLGEAIVLPDGDDCFRVIASEGGHGDFAPTNDEQIALLKFLSERHEHVSYERVVSGIGLAGIYEFILSLNGNSLPEIEDVPAYVSSQATAGDELAKRAFDIFVDAYAAEAANLALKVLAQGGVYLAGGIAAKNLDHFTDGRFLRSFRHKGRFADLVMEFPVAVITEPRVGLRGAAAIALEQARRAGGA